MPKAANKSAKQLPQKRSSRAVKGMTALSVPNLEAALAAAHAKGGAKFNSRIDRWHESIAVLNKAVAEQAIYNVALNDSKYWLSSGITDALKASDDAVDDAIEAYDKKHHTSFARDTWQDVSSYISFNQAAGRIKRLSKRKELFKAAPALPEYLTLLGEVDEIWKVISSLKLFVIKGRQPSGKIKEVDLTNTGLCAICCNIQKLNEGKRMVHHGFRISTGFGHYIGYRMGKCFGVGYRPYEKSTEANVAYLAELEGILKGARANLKRHKDGEVTEISVPEWVAGSPFQQFRTYKVGESGFDRVLEREIASIETGISNTRRAISGQKLMIANWKLKPLYDELHPPGKSPSTDK